MKKDPKAVRGAVQFSRHGGYFAYVYEHSTWRADHHFDTWEEAMRWVNHEVFRRRIGISLDNAFAPLREYVKGADLRRMHMRGMTF